MFEVGFTEIVLILGLALLVLGPEKLPGLAEKVGRWTGRARAMARQLRTQLEHEVTLEELAKSKPTAASADSTPSSSPDEPQSDATQTHTDSHPPAAEEPAKASPDQTTTNPAQ
jgi:sec-independent protein translocase protein TatB